MPSDHTYKAIIVGAHGLVGSSAFMEAAKLCHSQASTSSSSSGFFPPPDVLAFDQFPLGHKNGSSHGKSRITRLAIGEGDDYVALAKRSQTITQEIQQVTGKQLIHLKSEHCAPGLIIGPVSNNNAASYHGSAGGFLQETTRIAVANQIPFQHHGRDELAEIFPQFNLRDIDAGYCEDTMGYIDPDECIQANVELAKQYRGQLNTNEKVIGFEVRADGKVIVNTAKEQYLTRQLIIAAGPWLSQLVKDDLTTDLKVYRQTVYWFEVEKSQRDRFHRDKFPTFIWNLDAHNIIYGFPIMDDDSTIKIGAESFVTETDPDHVNREVSAAEKLAMYERFRRYLPGITQNCVKATTCLYTVAPNFRFLVDYLPGSNNVLIASACSGHGAKHAAAIGEALAQQSLTGRSNINIIDLFGGIESVRKRKAAYSP